MTIWLPPFDPEYQLPDDFNPKIDRIAILLEENLQIARRERDWDTHGWVFRPRRFQNGDLTHSYMADGNNNGLTVRALIAEAGPQKEDGKPAIVTINAYTHGWDAILKYLYRLYLEE